MTSAAPYYEIRNPIVVYFSAWPLHFCHHSFKTFCQAVLQPGMRRRALFTNSASTLGLVEQAFWRVPLYTEWVIASSSKVILARPPRHSTTRTFTLWDFGFSTHFSHPAAWKKSETDSAASFLHAYWYRDGNCNRLLSNTARWLSTVKNLLHFFVHAVLSLDSWPLRFFHNFHTHNLIS